MCLSCLRMKEELVSIYTCEDCCKKMVKDMAVDVTGRELMHALRTLGKRYRIVEAKEEVHAQ